MCALEVRNYPNVISLRYNEVEAHIIIFMKIVIKMNKDASINQF